MAAIKSSTLSSFRVLVVTFLKYVPDFYERRWPQEQTDLDLAQLGAGA